MLIFPHLCLIIIAIKFTYISQIPLKMLVNGKFKKLTSFGCCACVCACPQFIVSKQNSYIHCIIYSPLYITFVLLILQHFKFPCHRKKATLQTWLNWKPLLLIHVSPTKTWPVTATNPMWISIAARRNVVPTTNPAITSRRSSTPCAPMPGLKNGTTKSTAAPSPAESKFFSIG